MTNEKHNQKNFRSISVHDWGDVEFGQAIDLFVDAQNVASVLMRRFIRDQRGRDSYAAEDAYRELGVLIDRLSGK